MIDPKMIPDEAVEPVARALCIAEGCDPDRLRLKSSGKLWTAWDDEARAAIAAAINAWPGVDCRPTFGPSRIILPVPQDKVDV
jgi:hypothetical protein